MYLYIKAFHLMAVMSWMAALFYYPRLIIYPLEAKPGNDLAIFSLMRAKLIKVIMNPAMIATWIAGIAMFFLDPKYYLSSGWFHVKFLCLLGMTHFHFMCIKWHKNWDMGTQNKSSKYYRLMNEIPTVLMIIIVAMAVIKPF